MKRRLPIEDPRFARLRLALCRHHPPYVDLDEVALRVYDTLGRLPSKPTNERGRPGGMLREQDVLPGQPERQG